MTDTSLKPSGIRVLVADDNQAITMALGMMLEVLGYQYKVAHDGLTAVNVARAFLPQILILDINLPELSGYEICQTLRAEPELRNSVFIAQTGWSDPEYIERSKEVGFHHHLVKPVEVDQLIELLSQISGKAAA